MPVGMPIHPPRSIGPRTARATSLIALAVAVGVLGTPATPAHAYPRPGRTERVSVASDFTEEDNGSFLPAISADGRYVAFDSLASDLVPGDTNRCGSHSCTDVFVYDQETGTTERVSVASDGTEGNNLSRAPAISADGRYVAFYSGANLVHGDTNRKLGQRPVECC